MKEFVMNTKEKTCDNLFAFYNLIEVQNFNTFRKNSEFLIK